MVDPSSIALGAVADTAIKNATNRFVEGLSVRFAKKKYEEFAFKLNKGLPQYLAANYARCNTIKNLLSRNDPQSLNRCFVPPRFLVANKTVEADTFLERLAGDGARVVITGLAGSGKSVFMKYAYSKVLELGHTYYPIFFELRAMNQVEKKDGMLLDQIFKSIHSCCENFTEAQFKYGLQSGAFYFFLDGFDELSQGVRDQVSAEIADLSRDKYSNAIIVTSRPSDEFVSWPEFFESKLLPFDLDQCVDYISRLQYDQEKRDDFIADLRNGLFAKNRDFLSNPLLAAMMLLTYDSFGEIPEKKHVFYEKCFDVLSREHDSSKARYKRELFSGLDIDELERVFMFFCSFSFADRVISFSRENMEKYIREGLAACGISTDVHSLIRDFRESISIMELDGLYYEFAHRSFQEYFYAKFVTMDRKITLREKIGNLLKDFENENIVGMIADMDRAYFDDEFLLPETKILAARLKNIDPLENPTKILSKFYSMIHADTIQVGGEFEKRMLYTIKNTKNHILHRYARRYLKKRNIDVSELTKYELSNEERFNILLSNFNGEIKIHHKNNEKLKRVNAEQFAFAIKSCIEMQVEYLSSIQRARIKGISSIMRKKYTGE